MEKRSDSIDIMRGIGIFLVVFAHILKQNNVLPIKDWIYSFHMPLFFFISGMFIKKNELFKSFFWKKFVTIVIPYFFWAAISLLYWGLIESRFRTIDDFNLTKGVLGIPYANGNWLPYNEVLWFLPVLFITSILFKCTLNIRCRKTRIVLFVLYAILGYFIYKFDYLPWGINRSFRYIIFMLGGYIFKQKYLSMIESWSTIHRIFMFLGCVIVSVTSCFIKVKYEFFIYSTGFAGILCVFLMASLVPTMKLLLYLGKHTLFVLVTHGMLYRLLLGSLAVLFNIATDSIRESILLSIILSIIVIICLLLIEKIVLYFIPWSLGKTVQQR